MQTTPQSPAPVRVFVVEDSVPLRQRLKELLAGAGAADAGEAAGVAEATHAILAARPDVVVLDIQLADGSGFDVLRAVRDAAPEIDVYLWSSFAADAYRELALRLGARDFFDKARDIDRMREVFAGRCAAHH